MNTSLTNNILVNAKADFDDLYEFGNEIGKGRYATVKKCYCKKTRKCYAAKIIKNFRTKNTKMNLNIVENEVTALTLARSHSSIVTLYEVFHHKGETILILEYATEKDLHIYLDCEGAFEEEKACQIVYQILKAISFLHSKNILHLDIKPENVLLMNPLAPPSSKHNSSSSSNNSGIESVISDCLENKEEPVKVKLCDFSFSQIMMPGKPILGMMGTVAYSAPEVLQYEPLTKATDMWSLGVLTHVLLTEYTPFGNGTEKNLETETNILSVREKEFKCIEDYFDNISLEAQDFVENLLKFRPKLRLTVEEALNHKWFKKFGIVQDSTNTIENSSSHFNHVNLNGQKGTVELEIRDETLAKEIYTVNNGLSICKTVSSSLANTKIIEIKDDKNNNSLSALIETDSTDIKSSSSSSISSNENSECTSPKNDEILIESYKNSTNTNSLTNGSLISKLNSISMNASNDSHYSSSLKQSQSTQMTKSVLDSFIQTTTAFKLPTTNDHDKSTVSALTSSSVVVTQIASKLATCTATTAAAQY